MPAVMKLDDYAAKINASWRKTADCVLETALLCAEASAKLGMGEKKQLQKKLDFSAATLSKLVKIGEQPHLRDKAVKTLLPPSYTLVYQVAQLSPPEVDAAIKEGIISPTMSRADLASWVAERQGRAPDAAEEEAPRVLATLRVPQDYDTEKQMMLQKALEDLRAKFGFDLDQPKDPQTEEALKVLHRIDIHIRKHARKFIGELRSRKLSGASKLSAAEQRKLWPHSEQDVEIADDATWDVVEAVLAKVGAGDQFERLRDEALRLNGVEEDFVRQHRNLDHEQAMQELRRTMSKLNGRFAGKGHASSAAAHR